VRGVRGATSEGQDTEQCGLPPRESGGASVGQSCEDRKSDPGGPMIGVDPHRPRLTAMPRSRGIGRGGTAGQWELALKMTAPECREGIGGCL
jgi:hypothetical protein